MSEHVRCPNGHIIDAACAWHGDNKHFLWGHICRTDGRYYVWCPVDKVLGSGADVREAAESIGGWLS